MRPVAKVLFRPEEVHGASGIGKIFGPPPERNGDIADNPVRAPGRDFSIPDFHEERLAAIQTGGVYANRFLRKKPADRQRFKPSLPEPILAPVNGEAVLGGEIVERSKRGDQIGSRMEPPRDAGGEERLQGLSPFLHGYLQSRGQFPYNGAPALFSPCVS